MRTATFIVFPVVSAFLPALCLAQKNATVSPSPAPAMRTWKDITEKQSAEAEYVSFQNGLVTLKKRNGFTVAVPLDKLSKPDQEYVRAISGRTVAKTAAEPKPLAKAGPRPPAPIGSPTGRPPFADQEELRQRLSSGKWKGTTRSGQKLDLTFGSDGVAKFLHFIFVPGPSGVAGYVGISTEFKVTSAQSVTLGGGLGSAKALTRDRLAVTMETEGSKVPFVGAVGTVTVAIKDTVFELETAPRISPGAQPE